MEQKARSFFLGLFFILSLVSCDGGGNGASDRGAAAAPSDAENIPTAIEDNVLAIDVSQGCGVFRPNIPCVSVTICEPGTSNCQTIPRVLLDTGSYGLRVFSSQISINIPVVQNPQNGEVLGECVRYLDGTSHWGPVAVADVQLGQQKAPQIPIQVIAANFATVPSTCPNPESSPELAGYNGILGVGFRVEDCGLDCEEPLTNGPYLACSQSSCSPTAVPRQFQVSNPVAFLPADNNGVIVRFPSVTSQGAVNTQGFLIFGIGTRANNTLPAASVLMADDSARFRTQFNGRFYSDAFIDSGSNTITFPGMIPQCPPNQFPGFFCPAAPVRVSAIQTGANGSPEVPVSFEVGNTASLLQSGNWAFQNLATFSEDFFDWGLPFFFGRSVHVGIEGRPSPLGIGPYWAY